MTVGIFLIYLTSCGLERLDCADGFYRDEAGNCQVIWPADTAAVLDTEAGNGSTDGGSTDGGSTDGGSTDGGSTDGGSTGGTTDGGDTGPLAELTTTVTGRILNTNKQLEPGFEGSVWIFPSESVGHGVPDQSAALAGQNMTWGGDQTYSLSFAMTEGSSDVLAVYALFQDTYYGSSPELLVEAGSTQEGVDVDVIHFLSPGDGGSDTGLLEIRIGGELEDRLDLVGEGEELEILVYVYEDLPATSLPWESSDLEPVAEQTISWGGDGTAYEVHFEEFAGIERYYKVYARHPLVYGAATEVNLHGGDAALDRNIRLDTYLGP